MSRLAAPAAALALAAGVNSASVWVQSRWRLFGRHALTAHLALVTPPWAAALALTRACPPDGAEHCRAACGRWGGAWR